MTYDYLAHSIEYTVVSSRNAFSVANSKSAQISRDFESNCPFKLPALGNKDVIGYLIKLIPDTEIIGGNAFIHYSLEVKAVTYMNYLGIFITAGNPTWRVTDTLSSLQGRPFPTNINNYPIVLDGQGYNAVDLSFEYQPPVLIDNVGNIKAGKLDFVFLGIGQLRYLLTPIINNGGGKITITGTKIVLGESVNPVNVPYTSADKIGYFCLKFESVCGSTVKNGSAKLKDTVYKFLNRSTPIPNLMIATPCPPLWQGGDLNDIATDREKAEIICKFKEHATEIINDNHENTINSQKNEKK